MTKPLATISLAALERQRYTAAEAARERRSLDEYSVLLTLKFLLSESRIDDARRVVADYRASKEVTE